MKRSHSAIRAVALQQTTTYGFTLFTVTPGQSSVRKG